jgi:hypothetical protein
MSFTVYGENPGSGGHWEFARETAAGAVFKAVDLISDGTEVGSGHRCRFTSARTEPKTLAG